MALSASAAWPVLTTPLRAPLCIAERGTLSYTFEGAWGSIDGSATPGTCEGTYTWDGTEVAMPTGYLYTGIANGYGYVACSHLIGPGGAYLIAYNILPTIEMTPGSTHSDHTVRYSTWYYTDDSMGGAWSTVAWIENTLVLDEADPDGLVRGSASGTLWTPLW